MMLKQLSLVFRLFFKRKLSSVVIILSIAVAFSVSTLLYTFIQRERGTDRFHSRADRVYRLLSNDPFGDKEETLAYLRKDASAYVSANYPEIGNACKITELSADGSVVEYEADSYEKLMVLAVDTSFYSLFDYPFVAFSQTGRYDPSGITITDKLALRIFNRTDVLGEVLTLHHDTLKVDFAITRVIGAMAENTHLRFDALVSFDAFDNYLRGSTTYIELRNRASRSSLEAKISNDAQMPSLIGPGKGDYFLQALPDIYFDKSNVRNFTAARNPDFLMVLWLIICLTIFIATFNFLNLFIISLVDRRKEFGVRKIQGATKANVWGSVVFEIIVYVLVGLAVSIVFSVIGLPVFNEIFQSDMGSGYLFKPVVLGAASILVIALILIVSFVLTFYMDSVQPVSLLSDKRIVKIGFNKVFFTLQFVIALALILSAVVIVKQVQFIKSKSLGFEREIIELRLPRERNPADLRTLKTKIDQHSLFKSVSLSSGNPVSGNQQIRFDLNDKEFYSTYFMSGDENLIRTLDLELKSGTVPSSSAGGDKVVNERFIEHFGIKEPIGAPVPGGNGEKIIGVVSDFNVSSLKQEIPLYMIGFNEAPSKLLINYAGTPLSDAKDQIQVYWEEVFPNSPFVYSFLDDQLVSKHKDDLQFSRVISAFSFVSIVISCFGLFALAQSSCQKKGKEIAIRRTLGASSQSVMYLLVTDFGRWVLLSFGLASVLGYFGSRRWLESFAFRTTIDWQVFAMTLCIGMCFFLIAISSETVKAVLANPIKGLRYE